MKKNIFNWLVMTTVVITTFTFVGCGGGDDTMADGETGGIEEVTVGTHRIDVTFEGDTKGWKVMTVFIGNSYPNSTILSTLYENGAKLTTDGGHVSV